MVDAKSGSTQPGDSNAQPPPLLADSLANPVAIVEDSEEDAEGEADDEIPPAASAVAQYAADAASSAPSLAPAGAPSAPQIALTAPSASPSAAPSPRASSANATPQPTTVSPAALMTAGPSNPVPTPAVADFPHAPLSIPTYESEFGIHEVSSDYIEALPPVPADTLRTRFNSAASLRASTKKAARSSAVQQVQPDLYKLHVRAQLMSAKFFLGPGKRVHNVLSTSQWETGIDEMRAIRAFERIEELKADKKWSFRQPKKQRTGNVPKAHWDHVLDEMVRAQPECPTVESLLSNTFPLAALDAHRFPSGDAMEARVGIQSRFRLPRLRSSPSGRAKCAYSPVPSAAPAVGRRARAEARRRSGRHGGGRRGRRDSRGEPV